LEAKEFQIQALAEHDLFKQLSGNPYAITMMACFRANPLEPQTLKDIYIKVARERNIHGDL
jgi:hypothetical protein